jgi:two-component system chemotaxis response regulator CheY
MSKILLVDDEPTFCMFLKGILQSHGHEVFTASGGREALDVFQQQRPQFTLLDLYMPEMGGLEVLARIRAIDPGASVMILTAWGAEDMELTARQLGAVDFLSKTLSMDTIIRTMEGILHPSKGAGQAGLQTDTILLVDDNPQTRARYAHALRGSGYELRLAPDAFAALQVVDKETPGLVVLDLDMQDRLAADVLVQLRARNYRGGLILLTSRQSRYLVLEAAPLGPIDVLHKPVQQEALLLAVQIGLMPRQWH